LQFPFFNTPIAALAAPFTHRFGYTFYWPSGTLEDADGGRAAADSARVFWIDCRTRRRRILVGVHVLERAHVVYLCASWGMMIWCALQRCFFFLDGYLLVVFVSFFSNYGYPAHVCWMQATMGYRVQGVYTVTGNKKF
jgi:hypothetical protein